MGGQIDDDSEKTIIQELQSTENKYIQKEVQYEEIENVLSSKKMSGSGADHDEKLIQSADKVSQYEKKVSHKEIDENCSKIGGVTGDVETFIKQKLQSAE